MTYKGWTSGRRACDSCDLGGTVDTLQTVVGHTLDRHGLLLCPPSPSFYSLVPQLFPRPFRSGTQSSFLPPTHPTHHHCSSVSKSRVDISDIHNDHNDFPAPAVSGYIAGKTYQSVAKVAAVYTSAAKAAPTAAIFPC